MNTTAEKPVSIAKAALLALLACVLCLASFAAVSSQLHQVFHHDSDCDSAICLVAQLASGKISLTAAAGALIAAAVWFLAWIKTPELVRLPASRRRWLPPERAPPVFFH